MRPADWVGAASVPMICSVGWPSSGKVSRARCWSPWESTWTTCWPTSTSTGPPRGRHRPRVLSLTDGAAEALQAATQEAVHLGRNYVGSEHILLGLLRVEGGAARILAQHGVNLNRASWRTQELLDHWQFGRRGAS